MSTVSYLVYKTCVQLVYDRGYKDAYEHLQEVKKIDSQESFDIFMEDNDEEESMFAKYNRKPRFLKSFTYTNEDLGKRIMVVFGLSDKKAAKILADITRDYFNDNDEGYELEIVYLHEQEFTNTAKSFFEILESRVFIQHYLDLELVKNPGHHIRGALHYELLTPEDLKNFLAQTHLGLKSLLKIYSTDPPVKYRGFRKGDFIKIVRTPNVEGSLTRENYTYRLVV